ncbi:phage tail protein [Photorhabdus sp. SF281]|uniref:phage tail protein n=1 Tax=Photorhabdus sp. SF281 TaxID=3459527 RepID=UPI0040448F9D
MAKNEFLTFGIAEGANVLSNEEYAALAARVNGFSAGVAKSRELNKAWRQSSIITHILADFIAKESGNDVLDDGNIDALKSNMALAIKNALPEVRDATLTEKGIIQLSNATDSTSERLAATPRAVKYAYDLASTANTSATNANNNANTKLSKSQNGADIPDKNAFVKNLGLVETVNKANNAVPNSRRINGKVLTGDISLSAGDVGAFPGVTWFNSIPARSYVGPFSVGEGGGWLKGINVGSAGGDVGQVYITPLGELHAYFLNSNGNARGGIVNAYPVGAPIPWPLPNAPDGYIICSGQAFEKSKYPQLAVAYPSGVLPDLRGEFIRGWAGARDVDSGRVILSLQADELKAHSHSYQTIDEPGQGRAGGTGGKMYQKNTGSTGGNETRPRNIAFNYIVRAA